MTAPAVKRALTLRKEHLAELTTAELRAVAGAERGTMPCVTGPDTCAVSRAAISLCGCLSDWCSIDVC